MAVGSGVPYNSHVGNGVTTSFSYGFTLLDEDDLVVSVNGVVTADYTITGLGVANGGTVEFTVAPGNGSAVLIQRVIQPVRLSDYQDNGDLLADTVNLDFDRLWMALQGVIASTLGVLRVPYPEQVSALPGPTDRANKFLSFGPTGEILMSSGTGTDNGLRADLATNVGPGMIGWLWSQNYVAGTIGWAVQNAGMTPTMAGAIGNGIADDTLALQNWAASPFPKRGEPKTFKVTSAITFSTNTAKFDGCGMVIDGSTVTGAVLQCSGSLSAVPDLSVSPAADAVSLTFGSAHGLVERDVCVIYNPTNSSWSTRQLYYRAGEYFRVAAVPTSTTVKTMGGFYAGYTAANVDVYKLARNEAEINDLTVIGKPSGTGSPIKLQLATRVRLRNVSGVGSDYTGINLDRCFDVDVDASSQLVPVQLAAAKYAISVGNCQHVRIRGGLIEATRHSINVGGDDLTGAVPNRDVWMIGCHLANDSALSQVATADVHGNSQHIYYVNCTIRGGASFGGKDVHYWNCDIHGFNFATGSVAFGGSEWLGGIAEVRGCRLYGQLAYTQGIVRLFTDANVNSDSTLIIEDCVVDMPLCDTFARCDLTASTYKVNAVVRGITFVRAPNMTGVLRMVGTGAAGDGDFVVVDDITGGPASGVNLYVATNGYGAAVKCKLMEQRGTVAIAPVAAAPNAATSVNFRYEYGSKAPVVTLTLDAGTVNGKSVIGYLSSVSEAGFGANMRTADSTNFGVTTPNVNAHWSAGLSEI